MKLLGLKRFIAIFLTLAPIFFSFLFFSSAHALDNQIVYKVLASNPLLSLWDNQISLLSPG